MLELHDASERVPILKQQIRKKHEKKYKNKEIPKHSLLPPFQFVHEAIA
jgi:hypothetical protein